MGKVSESIYNNKNLLIPMADVSHIERRKAQNGYFIIMKHTTYNTEFDDYNNAIWMTDGDMESFKKAYCYFRHEKDIK